MCGGLNGLSGKSKTPFIGFQDLAQSLPGCVAEQFPHQTGFHLAPLHDQLIRIKMPLNMTLCDMRDKYEIVNSINIFICDYYYATTQGTPQHHSW